MPKDPSQDKSVQRIQLFSDLLVADSIDRIKFKLGKLHAAEIAHVLESLPQDQRDKLWNLLSPEMEGDVLTHVNDAVRRYLIRDTDTNELVAATQNLDADDLADILADLPQDVIEKLLQSMDEQDRRRLETVLSYADDSAGGLMNVDTITVRADITLDVVLRYLRFRRKIPKTTDHLYVVNREDVYQGTLALTDLLVHNPDTPVTEIINTDIEPILADMSAHDVAHLFERRDLVTAPVVNDDNQLLGRITIDDVVDVIRDEADHSLMSMAGLHEEDDMFAPVITSSRRRTVWLGINLLTAILASWVIGRFDTTIQQLVALAILMPIVASMGGIAGSQTLTLVIRGIAIGQVSRSNARRLISKELMVGALNGSLWAVVVAIVAILWFENTGLGIIIGIAMLLNLMVAALAGATIPLALHRVGIDPALAGGVVLTTVTDVIGFMMFLGMAALFLV